MATISFMALRVPCAGADGVRRLDRQDEHLAAAAGAARAGAGALEDRPNDQLLVVVARHHHQQFLGQLVVGDLTHLQAALLAAAEHVHLGHRRKAGVQQRLHHGVHPLGPHHRLDRWHRVALSHSQMNKP
jgi:hypothetical protein